MWKNVKQSKTEESSLSLNKDRSGRRGTEHMQENINLLREKLIESPRISARNNCLDISKRTFNRITKHDLKVHVYQKLLEHDLLGRLNFANWFLQRHVRFIEVIVFGDEATFHMNRRVNSICATK